MPNIYSLEYVSSMNFLLENKYNNLCQLCYNRCDVGDKHYGRRGALYCLTSGGGEVSYSRFDDVQIHFGVRMLKSQFIAKIFM